MDFQNVREGLITVSTSALEHKKETQNISRDVKAEVCRCRSKTDTYRPRADSWVITADMVPSVV